MYVENNRKKRARNKIIGTHRSVFYIITYISSTKVCLSVNPVYLNKK